LSDLCGCATHLLKLGYINGEKAFRTDSTLTKDSFSEADFNAAAQTDDSKSPGRWQFFFRIAESA
jgi:hypothetical protein